MDKITAIIISAILSAGFAGAIGFCVWLVKGFLAKTTEHIKELLDRDRTSLTEKIGRIEKQLSNHITETNDKIDKLTERVSELEVKNAERHAELEVKNAERHAELYKLLSSKSPDKKQ